MVNIKIAIVLILAFTSISLAASEAQKDVFVQAYNDYKSAIAAGNRFKALASARQAYVIGRPLFGDNHKNTAALALNYGRLLKGKEARDVLIESLDLHEKAYGPDAPQLVDPLLELAAGTAKDRFFVSSRRYYRRALKIVEQHAPDDKVLIGRLNMEIGAVALAKAKSADALGFLKKAEQALSHQTSDQARVALAKTKLWKGKYRIATKKYTRAVEELNYSLAIFNEFAPQSDLALTNHALLVEAYEKKGWRDEATKHCQAIGLAQPYQANQDIRPIYVAQAEYPEAARHGREGSVTVLLTVDKQGFVKNPQIVANTGFPGFKKSALEAVKKFRFAPRFVNGQAVDRENVRYTFIFEIEYK